MTTSHHASASPSAGIWTGSLGIRPRHGSRLSETYASMPQMVTRINGRPTMGELVTGNYFSLLG